MRIIEVVNNWPPEIFLDRHISALNDYWTRVTVISKQVSKSYASQASVGSGSINRSLAMPNFDHMSNLGKILSLRYLINRWYLKDTIRNSVVLGFVKSLQPDLIHFHDAGLALTMSWVARKLEIPYSLSIRGSDIHIHPHLQDGNIDRLKQVLQNAAGVHSVSDALWSNAVDICSLENYSKHQKTIYTTVPIFQAPPKVQYHSYELLKFISVGRLHWIKGYVRLMFAFRSLLDSGVNASLTIIGDGPARDEIVYWINALNLSSSIKLLGKLPYQEFCDMVINSDGFIQSSVAEGFSNATAEAMALGVPVFATDVGGTSEIVQDGVNGFLLDPFKPETWWEKLVLVKDARLMESVGQAGWKTAGEFFCAERHAREFADFYEKALHG